MSSQNGDHKLLESAKFSIIDKANNTITREALGRGSYGTVHAALYNGKQCVVKEIHPFLQKVTHKHSPLELVFEEINTLSSLRHPSIVQFLGVYFKEDDFSNDPPVPVLVMERMWKSLYAVFDNHPKQLSLINKVHILHDVICGLRYLHNKKKPIFHRDLNANNILLNEYLVAKISDLGQARALELMGDKTQLSTAPGNILHMPPEALVPKPIYDSSLDIFSFGCITIHTVTEKLPIPTDQFVRAELNVNMFVKRPEVERRQEYLDLMNDYLELQSIAIRCLDEPPSKRPSACEICDELQKYIQQLEKKFPGLYKQHKQDKLSLIYSNEVSKEEMQSKHENEIKEKEECISLLQSQLSNNKTKMEQDKNTFGEEINSLQIKLVEQEKMNRELSKIFQDQVDKFKKELETYSVTCIQLQQQIQDLKMQLKHEKSVVLQKKQKVVELEDQIQLTKDENQKEKLSFQHDKESLQKINDQLVLDNQLLEDKLRTEVANTVQEMNSNIQREREHFQEKLKELENDLLTNQAQMIKLKNEKGQLEEIFGKCQQEKETLQKRLNEQQTHYQIQADRLREEAKIELNGAHLQIQTIQNELKVKKAKLKVFQSNSKITDPGSRLHQKLLEIESAERDDRLSLLTVIKQQEAQLSGLRKKILAHKQELEKKSYHLSTLEFSLNEYQELSHSKEEKLKSLEEDHVALKKQLENNDRIQRHFEKELTNQRESIKQNEDQKKELADEINSLHDRYKTEIGNLRKDIEMYQSQIDNLEEICKLLKKETECKSENTKDRFQKLDDNERKSLVTSEKNLKQQIKYKDADIKDKIKRIESLENNYLQSHSSEYNYDLCWYPYLSLPVKLIRPSIAIIKDKVFVTGGYQYSPQGSRLEDYSQTLEDKSSIFCFDMAKCHCDTIASPVLLGTLANVDNRCILVSGADSIEDTLVGKVYMFCEERSHDQWKEFSKPLPTPRILACTCCYSNRWLIVCGGFVSTQSGLLETVSVVEILDTTTGEWHTLLDENCPDYSTILSCAVIGEELYVVGSDQVIKTSCNNFIKAATSNNTLVWDNVLIETEESNGKLYPFSVVEVNGEPMIIASMSDGEDDMTCVLMKDTGGRWGIMGKAVECQHSSAAAVTSSLELLLFGGSERVSVEEATDTSCKSSLIPTLNIHNEAWMSDIKPDETFMSKIKPSTIENTPPTVKGPVASDTPVTVIVNQPPNVSFTGPVHAIQFDHRGGTFQSPIHKVSLVVPPNALSDDEKVTVYMGATTTGPFDLPEDCKLRSAVVWLSVSPSDVEFKRSISVIVPHSAVFTSPQHQSMMKFVICEDHKGLRYKFTCSLNQYEIDKEQGVMELNKFAMVAVIASPEFSHCLEDERDMESYDSDDDFQDAPEDVESLNTLTDDTYQHQKNVQKHYMLPPACFLAILFWPCGEVPSCFRADVLYIQNLPTELYKVDILYKKQYYEDNGAYPEIVATQFILPADEVKCVLPCYGSKCDCLHGCDVIQMRDTNDVQILGFQQNTSQSKLSFKFTCNSGTPITCCFEFQGAKRLGKASSIDLLFNSRHPLMKAPTPPCLQGRFTNSETPYIVERGIHHRYVQMKEPVEKVHTLETIHDNSHNKIAASSEEGDMTESPPLKNLL